MFFNLLFAKCNFLEYQQIGVQDPASPNMEGMIYFHHDLMFFVVVIGNLLLGGIVGNIFLGYCEKHNLISNKPTDSVSHRIFSFFFTMIVFWFFALCIPLFISQFLFNIFEGALVWFQNYHGIGLNIFLTLCFLLIILMILVKIKRAFKYYYMLFSLRDQEGANPDIGATIVLTIGIIYAFFCYFCQIELSDIRISVAPHKEFCRFTYLDYETSINRTKYSFDCYSVPANESIRSLDTNNVIVVPIGSSLKFHTFSENGKYYWEVPSLGLKVYIFPQKTFIKSLYIEKEGQYYGECKGISSVSYSRVPIIIKAVNKSSFNFWISSRLRELEKLENSGGSKDN